MSFCCAVCKEYKQETHLQGRCELTRSIIKDSTDPKASCALGKPAIFSAGVADTCPIKVSAIMQSDFQMRDLDQTVISDLILNIKERGLLQPIMVRRIDRGYEIIFGRHRLEACRRLGYKEIPAIIKECSEEDAIFIQIAENIQRNSKEGIIKQGSFYVTLQHRGWSTYEIGKKIGKSAVYVGDCISVAVKLHPKLRQLVDQKRIMPSLAHRIAELSLDKQLEVAERALSEKWRVRDFELNVRGKETHTCHCLTCSVHGPLLQHHRKQPPLDDFYFVGAWIRRRSNEEHEKCVYCGHDVEKGEYVFPLKYKNNLTSFIACEQCAIPRLPEEFVKLFGHYCISDPFMRKTGLTLHALKVQEAKDVVQL